MAETIAGREAMGEAYSIVVVAEGAMPRDGHRSLRAAAEAGHAERLGGIGEQVAQALGASTGKTPAAWCWAIAARRQPQRL